MNITELARKLRVPTQELRDMLPKFGFDIGQRAIKVDDVVAERIFREWSKLMREYTAKQKQDAEQETVAATTAEAVPQKPIPIPPVITVRDFATELQLPVTRVMTELMKNGILAAMNERIDFETASIVAEDLGKKIQLLVQGEMKNEEKGSELSEEEQGTRLPRPPVIVVLGHVDHGKTKLLDAIRKTNVMAGEAGGITQHIGAYQVEKSGGAGSGFAGKHLLTFIDTPGHEAFSTMRSRGARVADLAILVVAADDGVQPQTIEALNIARSAELPIIVAINKMDKPDVNIERVKQQLSEHNIIPEEWGGKTMIVPLSAKTGQGLDVLLDAILLVAEMEKENIQASKEGMARGTIIESHVDAGEGPVATILVQSGVLTLNSILSVKGTFIGKARALKDHRGMTVREALPGMPVKILGLKFAPEVGDILRVVPDMKSIDRKVRTHEVMRKHLATSITELRMDEKKKGTTLDLIIKADVVGSLEAIILSLEKLSHPDVRIQVIVKGLGNIMDTDILRAEASTAEILGFHVMMTPHAEELAREKGVSVKLYKVIYDLLDDVKKLLEARLAPEIVTIPLGTLQVLATFRSEKKWMVVGGKVTKGKLEAKALVKVFRGGTEIARGNLDELQSGKEVVREVAEGQECGLKFIGDPVIQTNDVLEVYKEEKRERTL